MKIKSFLFLLLVIVCQISWGLDVPKLKGRVNDYSNTLSIDEVSKLEAKLKKIEDSTSNQIVVLLMKSLDGDVLEDFSMKVAETWKIGQKGKNNGIIISFFMDDHKDRIEVGYGLESVVTDAICDYILNNEVKPYFKDKKYFEGINVAIDKIVLSTTGEFQKEMAQDKKSNKAFIFFGILALIAGVFGYVHWSVSGIVGGIGAPIIWFFMFGSGMLAIIIAIILGFAVGILAYGLLSLCLGGGISGSSFGDGFLFSGSGDSSGFSGGGGDFGGGGGSGSW